MNLRILSALAQIADVQVFRLRDLMQQLGIDPKQPALLYRGVIKEAREVIPLVSDLQRRLPILEETKSQLEAKVLSQHRQITTLRARVTALETENRQLKSMTSQAEENATKYKRLKEFLRGQVDGDTLRVLSTLVSDAYMQALEVRAGLRPPPDPSRLSGIRQQLRVDLMEVLQVPKDELEVELLKLKKENDTLTSMIYGMLRPGE